MINKAIIVGNLGQDPEVKHLDGDRTVANFSIATSEKYNDRNGNKVENTEWHNIELWGKTAEVAEKYLKKGSRVYVEGKLKTENWEKEGVKHYKTKIVGFTIQMLDRKPEGSNQSPAANSSSVEPGGDDDLPF